MSDATPVAGRRRDGPRDWLLLAALVAAVAALLWWAGRGGERPLRQSPIGFDGLVAWLVEGGLDARGFRGGALLERDRVGLRVLPLYDGNVDHWRASPESAGELIREPDQVDIRRQVVDTKIRVLPTLVVLPKWRTGVALTGVAHPELLRDPADNPLDRRQLPGGGAGSVVVPAGGFRAFRVMSGPARGLRAQLYQAQVVRGSPCEPIIGDGDAMLLGRCRDGETAYWLLADPDLLNNHGLRLGDNALIARRLLGGLAAGRPVLVDYSTSVWTRDDRPAGGLENRRSWSDLGRFFAPPFAWLWTGFAVLAALVLWRASLRYGPPLVPGDGGPGAAKAVGIAAKARLLRLTGRDDALLRAHVGSRLQALAAELLGPRRPEGGESLEQVCRLLRRRDPELARHLHDAAAEAATLPAGAATAEAVRRLDRFETAIERVLHDLGRSPRAG